MPKFSYAQPTRTSYVAQGWGKQFSTSNFSTIQFLYYTLFVSFAPKNDLVSQMSSLQMFPPFSFFSPVYILSMMSYSPEELLGWLWSPVQTVSPSIFSYTLSFLISVAALQTEKALALLRKRVCSEKGSAQRKEKYLYYDYCVQHKHNTYTYTGQCEKN